MPILQDPPAPPLAAHVELSSVQCQAAAENLKVAASQLLTLIRQLRLSLLVMDKDTIQVEKEMQESKIEAIRDKAEMEIALLEDEYWKLRDQ